jgi:hypothetical protein
MVAGVEIRSVVEELLAEGKGVTDERKRRMEQAMCQYLRWRKCMHVSQMMEVP